MTKKCTPSSIAYWLVVIGAINWGLIGIGHFAGGNWNVVEAILGSWAWLENVVYILVGLSSIVLIKGCRCGACKDVTCTTCDSGAGNCKAGECSGGEAESSENSENSGSEM